MKHSAILCAILPLTIVSSNAASFLLSTGEASALDQSKALHTSTSPINFEIRFPSLNSAIIDAVDTPDSLLAEDTFQAASEMLRASAQTQSPLAEIMVIDEKKAVTSLPLEHIDWKSSK